MTDIMSGAMDDENMTDIMGGVMNGTNATMVSIFLKICSMLFLK